MFDVLKAIVVSGGLVLNSHRGKVKNEPKKSDLEAKYVQESSTAHTIVDDLVQDIALEILRSHHPDASLNAEEDTQRVEWFSKDKTRFCFHLDPLDGTLAYTKGRDDYAIGAGFSVDNEFVSSAIYFPARDRLYYAERGSGFKVVNGLGEPVPFERPDLPANTYVQKRCEAYITVLEQMNLVPFDSMGAHNTMIGVAEGRVAVQLYQKASPHDFGIPMVFLEAVGAVCTDEVGHPIHFDKDFNRLPYFFAFFDERAKEEFFGRL